MNAAAAIDRTRNIPLIGTSTHAAHTIISSLTRLAGSAGEVAGVTARRPGRRQRELEVHTMVVKAYAGHTPAELADAPVAALRGVSAATARKLKSALGMASIRDMATSQIFERADGVVTLADAEGDGSAATRKTPRQLSSLRQLASGPIADMRGVTPHQARVLEHTLRIDRVFVEHPVADPLEACITKNGFRLRRALHVLHGNRYGRDGPVWPVTVSAPEPDKLARQVDRIDQESGSPPVRRA